MTAAPAPLSLPFVEVSLENGSFGSTYLLIPREAFGSVSLIVHDGKAYVPRNKDGKRFRRCEANVAFTGPWADQVVLR